MDLNKAMIIGNVVRDPELRSLAAGQAVANFAIATNLVWVDQSGQKQQRAEFHNIVAWRKLGEVCAQYLRKGSKVYIEGRIETRDWTGQDGVKRYRTEIVAENMIMLDRAGGAAPAAASGQFSAQSQQFQPQNFGQNNFSQGQQPRQFGARASSNNFSAASQGNDFSGMSQSPTINYDEPVVSPLQNASGVDEVEDVKIEDIPF